MCSFLSLKMGLLATYIVMLQCPMRKTVGIFLFFLLISCVDAGEMTQTEFETYKTNCGKNDAAACVRLYYFYISSKHSFLPGLKADRKKAVLYAEKACDLNDSDGCFAAGMEHYYGDEWGKLPRDKEKGRRFLKRACALGKEDVCSYFMNPKF